MRRALVLSGGGSKGAYSVGVVKALLESGRKYDVIAGVSVGALIGAFIAQFPPDKQWASYNELERIWTKEVKNNKSIYKKWAPWFLTYIWSFWKGSIYTMRPLRDIVDKQLDLQKLQNSGVEFEVGVVSLQNNAYQTVNLSSNPEGNKQAVDWIWASCIFPILFEPVKINGQQWIDGGVRNVIPIKDVIKYNVKEIDAILTMPQEGYVSTTPEEYKAAYKVGIRASEILSEEVYINDLEQRCRNKDIKLNIFDPSDSVNNDSFEFNPEEIKTLIDKGYKETMMKLNNEKV